MNLLGESYVPVFSVLALVLLVGVPFWLLLRLILFIIDRMDRSAPPGGLAFCVWTQRFFLCVIAGCLALAFGGISLSAMMRLSELSQQFLGIVAVLGYSCYWLAILVVNFPGFPLRWNLSAFWPLQGLLLLSSIVFLLSGDIGFTFFVAIAAFFSGGFWYWNLAERMAITPFEELVEPS